MNQSIINEIEELSFGPSGIYYKLRDKLNKQIINTDAAKDTAGRTFISNLVHSNLWLAMKHVNITLQIIDFSDYWNGLGKKQKLKLLHELFAIMSTTLSFFWYFKTLKNIHGKAVYDFETISELRNIIGNFCHDSSNLYDVDFTNLIQEMEVYLLAQQKAYYLLPHIFVMRILRAIEKPPISLWPKGVAYFASMNHLFVGQQSSEWMNQPFMLGRSSLNPFLPEGNGEFWDTIMDAEDIQKLIDNLSQKHFELMDNDFGNDTFNKSYVNKNGGCLVPIISVIAPLLFVLVL